MKGQLLLIEIMTAKLGGKKDKTKEKKQRKMKNDINRKNEKKKSMKKKFRRRRWMRSARNRMGYEKASV